MQASLCHFREKFLVCEEKLDELFSCCVCQECQGPVISTSKILVGSMVAAQLSCLNGHTQSWQSQPYIRGTPEGNLLLAASILLSGSTYKHVNGMAKLLRLSFIGKSAFYTLQENVLCGDGRCDSTGHSAKYGTYNILDEKTGKIPAFSVVQVIEVTSSNAMEVEGCRRALNNVLSSNLQVPCLTTDRHISIMAEKRKTYPTIKHQYAVWHMAKWIVKKLTLKAKGKKCQDLLRGHLRRNQLRTVKV